MATPHSNTDYQEEDTELVDEPVTADKEKKSVGHKILNSRAVRRVTGGRKLASGGNAVAPDKDQSPSRVSVTTSRRQSNTMSAQSRQDKKDKQRSKQQQQPEPYAIPPAPGQQHNPPPQGPFFQPESPNTSPSTTAEGFVIIQQPGVGQHNKQSYQSAVRPATHAQLPLHLVHQPPPAAASHHVAQSLGYDHLAQRTTDVPNQPDHTHQMGKEEGDDPPSVDSDQRVQALELNNMRLKREKTTMESTLAEYEQQILAKDREITRLRKPKTSPFLLSGVSEKDTKLEMSLVDRSAQLTERTAERDALQQDKDLLQQELYELQTKYKALETEKQTATHQIETATHQKETVRKERATLEEDITELREQLEKVEREKKELIHSSKEQQLKERVKELENEMRGIDVERKASEEALMKQCQNNQDQLTQLLQAAQEEVQLLKSKPVELQLRQQLKDAQDELKNANAKVTVLEETKRLVQFDLEEEKRKVTELKDEVAGQKKETEILEQDLEQEKEKVAEVTKHTEEKIAEQNGELETLRHKLASALEKKEKYKAKLADQKKAQEIAQAMEGGVDKNENETRLEQQLAMHDEETQKIREDYEIRLADLRQQLETQQPHDEWTTLDDGSQTTGGAGASPLASLEDKRKTVELQLEQLAVKDQQITGLMEDVRTRDFLVTELRENLHREELLSKKLGTYVSQLKSDLKKATIAKDELSEEIKTARATLEVKEAELQRMAEESNECMASMADTEKESSREVLQLRERLKEKSTHLDNALMSLDRVTRAQQSEKAEKAQLQQAVDRLQRRIDHKDGVHKRELADADLVKEELEKKKSELDDLLKNFTDLKAQHVKVVKEHIDSTEAVNTKQRQIEAMKQKLKALQEELGFTQAQAITYKDDFEQERSDREKKHQEMESIREQSAVVVNRLETTIRELEKENKNLTQRAGVANTDKERFHQLQEDYQISQSQIIAYKKQMDIGKRELEEERKKVEQKLKIIEQKQTSIDGLNNQLRLLSNENAQLKRAASNAQMETNRADRLQNEIEHMTAQNRELERTIAQLKHSNQVLSGRLQQHKPQSHHSPRLEHAALSGQHPGAINVRPQSEHGQGWQQPNAQQVFQEQQRLEQERLRQQRLEQERLRQQQQQDQQRRDQEILRQQQQDQQRREQEFRRQQEQTRKEQERLYQQRQQEAIALSHEESGDRSGPSALSPHFNQYGGRTCDDSVLMHTNAAPVPRSMDSLPSHSMRGQQYPYPPHHHTSGHPLGYNPAPLHLNSQQQSPMQLFDSIPGGQGQRGVGAEGRLQSSQAPRQHPPAPSQPAEYSRATAESSSEHKSDTSDVAENPLIEGIDKDMIEAQHVIEKMYVEPADTIEGAGPDDSFEIPFDPNLVCPKCGRQFRRGEIQKLRKHHITCQE